MRNEVTRPVKARRYGSEGLMPVDKYNCPYRGTAACVSASGGSYCGGYGGDMPIKGSQLFSVKCLEENNADFVLRGALRAPRHLVYPL